MKCNSALLWAMLSLTIGASSQAADSALYFPPPGRDIRNQDRRAPTEVGLDGAVVGRINDFISQHPYPQGNAQPRWALWRHGRLVHVEGDFQQTVDVASLRKTWHAMIVGAAIQQQKIPSHHQRIREWLPELQGNDAEATWRDVITQSAGFDYPYGDYPDFKPGEMWTYSDLNLVHLCNALARAYGKKDYRDAYADVAKRAYFDAIGLEGWSTVIKVDSKFGREDGVRFVLSLEHMGRLGLLALARGRWNGVQLVPAWFVEQLETKQTYGMRSNYAGPNDGTIGLGNYPGRFDEAPYGYLTWVNTDGDYFPDADRRWAWASGAGGTKIMGNRANGLVFAGVAIELAPQPDSIPHILDTSIQGANPLSKGPAIETVGRWDRFDASVINARRYKNPYTDVALDVVYTRPDGGTVKFWGFHDGAAIWRFRFMPDQVGRWKYRATFSDGSPGAEGDFECVASAIPGMISRDEANAAWFGFEGGEHRLIRGLHVGDRLFAENWPASQRQAFLDWAQRQGYNLLSVASHYLNRNSDDRGRGWDTPALWPLAAAEFQKLELLLDDLAKRGIIVFPFAGFFGRDSNFPRDAAQQEVYVRYVLARLGSYWNVLLNVAGPEPHLKGHPYLTIDEINRLGRLIRQTDVFDHPLTVHNPTGDDAFRDATWLSFGTLQGPKTNDLDRLSAGLRRNHHAGKPLLAQETLWTGNVNHIRALGGRDYTDDELRHNAWVIHMSAAALVFADNAGGNSSAGFSGSLEPMQADQRRHDIIKQVWDLAEQFPFYRLTPRQDLTSAGYCLAEPGQHYLVYLPSPAEVNVKVEGGPFQVQWIAASNATTRRDGGSTKDGRNLKPPEAKGDWLLWLVRQ